MARSWIMSWNGMRFMIRISRPEEKPAVEKRPRQTGMRSGDKKMASGKVKGITIEFNGDTTKLNKAISETDKKIRSVDKDLKAVNRALKFNPGNTELLAQKQILLKEKIEQTKQKLDALRQAQEKLDQDPSVDKTSQEYMELRRKIIETESKLEHFESELKKMDNIKFEKLGKQVQDVGEKMKTVGTNMTKYVTGPIIAGAGMAVKAFKEVDEGMDIIVEKTGATGEALEAMKESAENLAKTIPTDFETAGTAIGEVSTRFHLTGDDLEELSGLFIKFADLNDTDVTSAVDQTQKALAAFGMDASDAGGLLDRLNAVGQDTGVSMDTLLEGLVQNGTAFQEMGLSADQAAIMMGQMETSGANSEAVMGGLRRALKNAAKDGVPLDEALKNLQDTILNGADGMDGLTAAYDLFGKSGDQIYGAVKNGTLDFSALGEAANDVSGSVENTFNETLDPADKFTMMMNGLKVTGYEIGGVILDYVAPALEKLSEWIQNLADKWESLDPEMQGFIIKAAGIIAVAGPVIAILGGIVTKVGMLITVLPNLIGAFSKVTSVVGLVSKAFSFMLGPVGLVIAAIAAAIAIGILLYKNWDKIKAAASKLKNFIVDKFTAMKDGVVNVFRKIKEAMVKPIEKARDLIRGIIDKIKGFFNFKFKLPHIKLPHFGIDPPGWHLGDLLEGVIPSLGIDWYAKGGIFNKPKVIGVGEAGPEAVVPIDKLQAMISESNSQLVAAMITAMQAMNTGSSGGEFKFVVNLGGAQVATEIFKLNKQGKMIMEA